jgi:hypothetical protein
LKSEIRENPLLTGNLLAKVMSACNTVEFVWIENNPILREDVTPINLGGCLSLGEIYYNGNNAYGNLNALSVVSRPKLQYIYMERNNISGNIPDLPSNNITQMYAHPCPRTWPAD